MGRLESIHQQKDKDREEESLIERVLDQSRGLLFHICCYTQSCHRSTHVVYSNASRGTEI